MNAGGEGDDAALQSVILATIAVLESKAAAYSSARQPDFARAERVEIEALRALLRAPAEVPAPPAKKRRTSFAGNPRGKQESKRFLSRNQYILIAVAAVVLAGIAVFYYWAPAANEGQISTGSTQISVFKDEHTMGNPAAPIKVLEYAAPTCPHCAHFAVTGLPIIKREYIDTGKVFYIFRVYPLRAADAAVEAIAHCLPKDQYFPFIEMMFRQQVEWDPDGYQVGDVGAAIIRMAQSTGMPPSRAEQCITDKSEADYINLVAQDGEQKYNIEETPTFIVNGTMLETPFGEDPVDTLQARINSLLAKKVP
ncbi:MAG: thioredoxin domain-containing protein [Alphaproteobacteria bacterium]|nr:thioredoxin domain-containing protein [Alphaproteobacteria bacterium]